MLDILVVDDNNFIRKVVSAMITDSGHTPIVANGHQEAIKVLANQSIDLILMDIEMPEMDGFELTEKIRLLYPSWIPIIFLSSNDSEAYLSRGIDAGGDDYLTKPVKQVILSAKIRAMERIAHMQEKLDKANQQLQMLSNIDPLTQVLNRRGFEDMLAKAWGSNVRQKGELSLLMVDIDFFKAYNDHYGHLEGDNCLINVASALNSTLNRSTDFMARYGGEEFVIVLPFTPIDGARFKAKEILKKLANQQIKHEYSSVSAFVSISIGVSSTIFNASTVTELIKQADLALYRAKETGRNKHCVFEQ